MEENTQGLNQNPKRNYKAVLIISVCVAVLIVTGALAAHYYKKSPSTSTLGATKTSSKPVTEVKVASMLDGVLYGKDRASRHPLAVSVENYPDARPQSGLSQASIVYEAITEGGITRYLAIFGPKDVTEIGPIRSARLFFMDFVKEYDAFFAHAGGNEDALAKMDSYGIKDLNHSESYFWRDYKGSSVASEHTLYSSTDKLYSYAKSKKFDTETSSFTALKFKTDGPAAAVGKGVEIDFSSDSYKVRWNYDPTKNQYLRFLAGKADVDRTNSEQLSAKNIVIQTVGRTFQPTGSYGSQNYVFQNTGTGQAYILRDGQVIKATWKKASLNDRTKYFDEAGAEIQFNPGNTWYEIVPPEIKAPTFF